jgi:hypothetical protein
MTTPPNAPGWYTDPDAPGQQRWWDGTRWTGFTTAWAQDAQSPLTGPVGASATTSSTEASSTRHAQRRWRPSLTTWIVAAIAVLVAIIGAGTNGFGGFLIALALFGLGAGVWTLVSARPSWLNLPPRRGIGGAVLGISFAVLLLGGIVTPHAQQTSLAGAEPVAESPTATPRTSVAPAAEPTRTPTPTPTPVKSVQVVETTDPIPYGQTSYEDPEIDAGTNVVVTGGAAGSKVSRWEITLVDGVETGRVLVSETVAVAPVDEVTAIGIRQPAPAPAPEAVPEGGGCHPNYAGPCVPVDSDVDCAGGSGNGPSYVAGPVQVIGPDVYDLDRNGDGIACD